jgi:hypothetical protein
LGVGGFGVRGSGLSSFLSKGGSGLSSFLSKGGSGLSFGVRGSALGFRVSRTQAQTDTCNNSQHLSLQALTSKNIQLTSKNIQHPRTSKHSHPRTSNYSHQRKHRQTHPSTPIISPSPLSLSLSLSRERTHALFTHTLSLCPLSPPPSLPQSPGHDPLRDPVPQLLLNTFWDNTIGSCYDLTTSLRREGVGLGLGLGFRLLL